MMLSRLDHQPPWLVDAGAVVVGLLLTVAAYAWVAVPSQQRQAERQARAAEAVTQAEEVAALESRGQTLDQQLVRRQAELDAMPVQLGRSAELNRQIAALIELAQTQGLEVLQLQPGVTTRGREYAWTELRLEAVAGFAQHLSFLDELHSQFASISVAAVQLDSRTRDAVPRPRATLRLRWFTELGPNADAVVAGADSSPAGR
jgi:Tfp pilus assembly protein PilO